MRKVLAFVVALTMGSGVCWASPTVNDGTFYPCTDGFSVTLTSYTWTLVPSSQCSGRSNIVLTNRSANTGDFVGITTLTSTTPTISTATICILIPKGTNDRPYPLDQGTYLWMHTTHTANETVTGQEFIQR